MLDGVYHKNEKKRSLVGYGPDAYHAHLIEFGTDQRFVKNYRGKPGVRKGVGRMEKRPILQPVLESEAGAVKRILSETWVD